MKITLKHLFAFFGALMMLNFDVPPAQAESHASSSAPGYVRVRRGAWRRMQQQARREEAAKKMEHNRFEQEHKMRFQKENQARNMRMNHGHGKRRIKTYKWKKRGGC